MTTETKYVKQGVKYIDRCAVCGQASEEHHDFEPTIMPESCIDSSGCPTGPVCVEFQPDSADLFCTVCSHHRGCHKEKP